MAAKTRGLKRREAEGKIRDVSEKKKKKKENVLQTQEERLEVDEEGQRLQHEKGVLTQTLHRLKDERDSVRMTVSECEIEALKAAQEAAMTKLKMEMKALRAKIKKVKETQTAELAKLKRQRIEWLEKEENLEEEVEATQRALDLVQERMVQRKLPPLPKEIYFEVAKHVHKSEALAFAMTCRASRDAMKEALKARERNTETSVKWLRTSRKHYKKNNGVPVSRDWIKWAFSMEWRYATRSKYNDKNKGELLTYLASRGGFKDVLVWLKSKGCVLSSHACYGAFAEGGHIKVLKYLKREGEEFSKWTCAFAAEGGHIDVLKYLKSEGVPFDSWTYNGAAKGGHLDVLKYLKSEGVPLDSRACYGAALGGYIHVLKYLKSEGLEFHPYTCNGAAYGGHINVLKYFKSEGVPFDSENCRHAAMGGHVDVLKYLKSEGMSFDSWTCKYAAFEGHIDVLKYLKSEGVPFDALACDWAADEGHIDVLKYLKSEGVKFSKRTCEYAALGGQLELLKWLRSEEVKCPWDIQNCLREAEVQGHDEVATWIKSFL